MKKSLLILTLALGLFSFYGHAQDNGIRAGWNTAGTFVNGNQIQGNLQNFYVGFFRNNKFGGILALHTGLEYLQNGWQKDNEKRVAHMLSVPIGLRVKLGPIFAIGGAGLNFKVAENNEGVLTNATPKNNVFDLPLFLGLGVKIAIVSIEARYNWGMVETNNLGYQNQYFQLGAGLHF
jgi:hypothetical protein